MNAPVNSPWGKIDDCEQLAGAVFIVSTPSHGGIMVKQGHFEFSDEAMHFGAERFGEWLCFEEDCAYAICIFEMRKKGVSLLDRVSDRDIRLSLLTWFPIYAEVNGIETR